MRDVQPTTPGTSWILLVLLLHHDGTSVPKKNNKLDAHPYTISSRGWVREIDEQINVFFRVQSFAFPKLVARVFPFLKSDVGEVIYLAEKRVL